MTSESTQPVFSEFGNPNLEVLYTEDEIRARIRELGEQ